MAQIKNFGLVGVGSSVQFGKGGAQLKSTAADAFQFRNAADGAFATVTADNVVADTLKGQTGKILVVDAAGKLALDSKLAADVATSASVTTVATDLSNHITAYNTETADIRADFAAADTALDGRLDTVEADLNTAVTGVKARLTTAESDIDAVEGRATTLETEATNMQNAVGLTETGTLTAFSGTNHVDGLTIRAAIAALDTAAGTLDSEKLDLAGGTMTGALILSGAPTAALGAATKGYVDGLIAGITWEAPVVNSVALIANLDGTGLVAGDRIHVAEDDKIYTWDGAAFDTGVVLAEGEAFFNKSNDSAYVFNGTDLVQFTGTGQITAGLGMSQTGNRLDVEVSGTGGLTFTPDTSSATSTLALKLDGSTLSVGADGVRVAASVITSISTAQSAADAAQGDADAIIASVGLTAGTGAKPDFTSLNYILAADTFFSAVNKLDTAVKARQTAHEGLGTMSAQNATAVAITGGTINGTAIGGTTAAAGAFTTLSSSGEATLASATVTDLGIATKTAIVLAGSTGALESDAALTFDTTTDTLTIGSGTGGLITVEAIDGLALPTDTDTDHAASVQYVLNKISASTGASSALQTEIDAIETAVGLNANGTKPSFTSINYVAATDTFFAAVNKLDTAVKARADAIAALNLDALTDVTIATVADGNFLKYNGTTSQWENVAPTTTMVGEGTNLYHTTARARGAVSATGTGFSYDSATGVFTLASAVAATADTVAVRGTGGVLTVATPTASEHAATKGYVDSELASLVGGGQVAKGFYKTFAANATTTITAFTGMITRIKVKVTTAGGVDDVTATMDPAGTPTALVAAGDVDGSTTGIYVIELAEVNTNTTIDVVSAGLTAGTIIVEYLPTAA